VIGDPIAQSLSPLVHNAAFNHLKLDCTYIAYRIIKGDLKDEIESLKSIQISGFNVTIPHKIDVINYLDELHKDCQVIGAVNTVLYKNDRLIGFNTDMDGFTDPIRRRNLTINGSNVLLIGAGGAARAIVTAVAKEKAKKISIANRTTKAAETLSLFANKLGLDAEVINFNESGECASKYNFIINSTSIGLRNEPSPISTKKINKNNVVYDIIYQPMNTALIKESKKNGATIIYGYEMFLSQAIRSFEIWHNIRAPVEIMKKALLGGFYAGS